jgi:superfamily II DNA helicase RecQ
VLTSPEIALHKNFLSILHHKPFLDRLVLIAIDELHIVDHSGKSFRQDYSYLKVLRTRIGPKVPWFGMSATLDPVMLITVKSSVGFNDNVRVITTNINRPDLLYNLQRIQRPVASHEDLHFVTQPTRSLEGAESISITHIPKTIIYYDRIFEILAIVRQLREWIKIGDPHQVVMPYHSELSEGPNLQRICATTIKTPHHCGHRCYGNGDQQSRCRTSGELETTIKSMRFDTTCRLSRSVYQCDW